MRSCMEKHFTNDTTLCKYSINSTLKKKKEGINLISYTEKVITWVHMHEFGEYQMKLT